MSLDGELGASNRRRTVGSLTFEMREVWRRTVRFSYARNGGIRLSASGGSAFGGLMRAADGGQYPARNPSPARFSGREGPFVLVLVIVLVIDPLQPRTRPPPAMGCPERCQDVE